MNYIKEMNAFHAKRETEPLSIAASMLWFVLMDVNNRARWKKQFSTPVSLLTGKTGLTEGTFKSARSELRKKGYIRVKSQSGNRAAIYEMVSLADEGKAYVPGGNGGDNHEDNDNHDDKADHNNDASHSESETVETLAAPCLSASGTTPGKQTNHTGGSKSDGKVNRKAAGKAGTLNKRKEIKQKEIKDQHHAAADVILFYRDNFTTSRSAHPAQDIGPHITDKLIRWTGDLGEELVRCAMERALNQGVTKWAYTEKILQKWADKGVRTIADVSALDLAFEQKQANCQQQRTNRPAEIVPDWFREREQQQESADGQVKAEVPVFDADAADRERVELEALLALHSNKGKRELQGSHLQ